MSFEMSIRARLLVTVSVIALLSIAGMGVYSYRNQTEQLRHRFKDLAKSENRLFESILRSEEEGLGQAVAGFSRLEQFHTPLATQDREALLQVAAPVFQELKSRHNITHMYFITPDGTVLLRAHRPEQFGDRLQRATFLQASATRRPASGLEMGRNFFSLRCVAPVFSQGELIGYLELAEEVDHIFAQMTAITGNNFCLFLPQDYLARYNPELPVSHRGSFSILYPSDLRMSVELGKEFGDTVQQGRSEFVVKTVSLDKERLVIAAGPITDAFGDTAGVLFSWQNVSLLYAAVWRGVVTSLAVFAAILIGGNLLLYLSMKKSLAMFHALRQHIQTLTRTWDLNRDIQVESHDEIGELATDINQMQEEMRKLKGTLEQRAEELAATNQELESFSYTLSHDLRLPLTRIYSASQLLQEGYSDRLDETGHFLIHDLCSASERMDELIEAILTLSKIGRQELWIETVDLATLAREQAVELQMTDPGRQVTLLVPEHLICLGDRKLLKVALTNLLENAWKYSRPVAEPRVELGMLEQDGSRIFFVRDNGVGFDMKHADQLFAPFKRLHPSAEFSGTGIGLATVQKVIHRHGGTIWGVGEVGKGATFFFTLPETSPGSSQQQ